MGVKNLFISFRGRKIDNYKFEEEKGAKSVDDKYSEVEEYANKNDLEWENEIENKDRNEEIAKKRVQSLIKYFSGNILENKDNELVLKHINNILNYEHKLKDFFTGDFKSFGKDDHIQRKVYSVEYSGDIKVNYKEYLVENDGGLTAKYFAILIEMLNSDNMYKHIYEKEQFGLYELKQLLEALYKFKNKEATQSEIDSFMNNLFDNTSNNKYTTADFFKEYINVIKNNISDSEYESSLFKKTEYFEYASSFKDNYPFIYANKSIFDLTYTNDETNENVKVDYKKMSTDEQFEFIMNFILASYESEINYYKLNYNLTGSVSYIASEAAQSELGHQNKKNKSITDKIIDIYTTEDNYESTGTPFMSTVDGREDLEASYTLYAVTEKDKYPLLRTNCKFNNSGKSNTHISCSSLDDYGYNLTNQQIENILDLIESKIFNNGLLNLNASAKDINQFKADITMIEILGNQLKNNEKYATIEKRLKNIKTKMSIAFFDYLSRKDTTTIFNEEYKEEDNMYMLFNINESSYLRPIAGYIYNYDNSQSNVIKEILEEKEKVFIGGKNNAASQYNEIINKLGEHPEIDAEKLEKYLDFLKTIADPYYKKDDDENNKTL